MVMIAFTNVRFLCCCGYEHEGQLCTAARGEGSSGRGQDCRWSRCVMAMGKGNIMQRNVPVEVGMNGHVCSFIHFD